MRTVEPVTLKVKYVNLMYKYISKFMTDFLFKDILEIIKPIEKYYTNDVDVLINAIQTQQIQYVDGYFIGKFDARITKELKKLGAVWDKRKKAFKIEKSLLPQQIIGAMATASIYRMAMHKAVLEVINHLNFDKAMPQLKEFLDIPLDMVLEDLDGETQYRFGGKNAGKKGPGKSTPPSGGSGTDEGGTGSDTDKDGKDTGKDTGSTGGGKDTDTDTDTGAGDGAGAGGTSDGGDKGGGSTGSDSTDGTDTGKDSGAGTSGTEGKDDKAGKKGKSTLEKFEEAIKIVPKVDDSTREYLKNEYTENVGLSIKNFTDKEIIKLRQAVEKNTFQGLENNQSLVNFIKKEFNVTLKKAQFLARNETRLFVTTYNLAEFKQLGIKQYIWRTSHDDRVRASHKLMDKRIVDIDTPPTETGGKHAGQDYNCRCKMVAVLPELK